MKETIETRAIAEAPRNYMSEGGGHHLRDLTHEGCSRTGARGRRNGSASRAGQ